MKKVSTGISNLKGDDETIAESDTEKAGELNSFFLENMFVEENVNSIQTFKIEVVELV